MIKISKLLKKLFKIYIVFAALAGTLVILLIAYIPIALQLREVELPNGFRLKSTAFIRKKVVIMDENRKVVVGPDVTHFKWCNDLISGSRAVEQKEGKTSFENFSYIRKENTGKYDLVEDACPSMQEKTFLDLVKNPKYIRSRIQ